MVKKIGDNGKPKGNGSYKVQKDKINRLEADTWYVAKFESHNEGETKYGPYIRLTFKILSGRTEDDEKAVGLLVSSMQNAVISPKTDLYKFVKVFEDDRELEIDEEIDFETYYGKKVKVFIEDRKRKAGDTGPVYQNATKIKRYIKKAK